MAAMITADRLFVAAAFQSDTSHRLETTAGVLRADIIAAVNAIDDWVVANAAAFNTAIPTAARTGLTTAQKANLLAAVVLRRYAVGA